MKPFDNVVISATEPKNKADVWIQHSKNMLKASGSSFSAYGVTGTNKEDGSISVSGNATSANVYLIGLKKINKDDISSGDYTLSINNEEIMSDVSVRLRKVSTSGSKTEIITQALDTINKEISLNSSNLIGSDTSYIELDLYLKTQKQYNFTIYPQFQRGKATEYEVPVNDDILVNDDGVYNSVVNKKEDYIPVFDTTYIKTGTGIVKFCSVINKVAYISFELPLKAVSLSNQQVKLVTGLPKAIANFNDIGYLFRNNALYKTLRFRINPGGELISWYNSAIELQVNDTILLNISYPVQ